MTIMTTMIIDHHTYIKQKIDEWIVAAVRHCQPVHAEPDDVDVWISANDNYNALYLYFCLYLLTGKFSTISYLYIRICEENHMIRR